MKAILPLVCLLLPCVAAAQTAPIAFYPADPTAPPPVLPGPLADQSPPPVTTLAAPAEPPRVLKVMSKPVEVFHPAPPPGASKTATVRARLEFVARPAAAPSPVRLTATTAPSTPLTEERKSELRAARALHSFIFVSATVHDGVRTRLTWWISGSNGARLFSGWSNVDFQHLQGVGSFAWEGRSYSLLMGVGTDSAAARARRAAVIGRTIPPPDIPALPADRPAFILTSGDPEDAAGRAPMEALHLLYQHEAPRLVAAHQSREQARQERAEFLRLHPPQPLDITIRCYAEPPPPPLNAPADAGEKGGSAP